MKNIIIIATMVLLLTTTGYCATYYVNGASGLDANPGTIANPWKTIYKANQTLVAGDTVYFRGNSDGSYYTWNVGDISTSSEGINPKNSGTSGNPITYAIYPGEKVNFVGNTDHSRGINIAGKRYIKVTGYDGSTSAKNLKFSNMFDFLWIHDGSSTYPYGTGGSYNEIAYCEFAGTNAHLAASTGYRVSTIYRNSSYNWIHHCTFRDMGGASTNYDVGVGLEIGYDDCGKDSGDGICHDTTSHNVVEDSVFYHAGHHNIGVMNKYNVIRNNIVHNEQYWSGVDGVYYGYRNFMIYGTYNLDFAHGYNLIENNSISHAASHYMNTNTHAFHFATSNNIVRYNNLFANANNVFYMENHSGATTGVVSYNHIYNNTFMANGYNAALPSAANPPNPRVGDPPDRSPFTFVDRGASLGNQSWWATNMYGNVIKNNLFWKNADSTYAKLYTNNNWQYGRTMDTCGTGHNERCGATVLEPNWIDASGNPMFVNEGVYGSPSNATGNKEWYWGSNNPDGSDVTTIVTQPDFTLQNGSPVIDQGAHLTTATGSGSGSTSLTVADAKYFQPGWGKWSSGGPSIAADTICVGTVSSCALISSINYTTNNITLASTLTWSNGASVWLYKNSRGTQVLYGSAPDYGANEYGAGNGQAGLLAPGNLRLLVP